MWKSSLIVVVVSTLLLSGMAQAGDITKPGDTVQGVPNDGDWPGDEAPPLAIDDNTATKYLHFKGDFDPDPGTAGAGFRVTPSATGTIVTGLTFTTANDAEPRDPVAFELSGSNVAIDGPYTLIASGPIVDFDQATPWPRLTMNTTPISFANAAPYDHYQLLFTDIRDRAAANSMQIAEVELLGQILKAHDPDPPDGTENVTAQVVRWAAGETAAFHNVYFGTNPTPGAAEFIQPQLLPLTVYWHIPGLTAGTTYYWRIDEVEADLTTIHTGDVWSFRAAPSTAHNPSPPDGAKYMDTDVKLSWTPGFDAVKHDVYFGADRTEVANGTGTTFKGRLPDETYTPAGIVKDTTYYWRIDEVEIDDTTKHKGDVWSFSTDTIPITDPDLIGWWKLDGGSGAMAIDWSGYNHHGTIMGDPEWVIGYDGGALKLDGDGDYVDIGSVGISGMAPRTIAGWVRATTTAIPSWTSVFGFAHDGGGDGTYFDIEVDDAGHYGVYVYGWGAIVCDVDRRWHHFAATYDGSGGSWYLDGQLLGSQPGAIATIDQVRIGARLSYPNFFPGLVDDVRIYNKPLTQSKIQEIMRGDPKLARDPSPANGSTVDIIKATSLGWSPGDSAASHDVYFGTDREAVVDASTSSPDFKVRQPGTTYSLTGLVEFGSGARYWRVDEVEVDNTTIHKGRVWSFTIADYLIVDDFEDYDDYCNRIFWTWADGFGHSGDPGCGVPPFGGNGTGSTVGYGPDPPFAEQDIVHEGAQSMPMDYNNATLPYYSEAERAWELPQDWTRYDVKALTLWFHGDPPNVAEQLYVAVEDSTGKRKVVSHPDPNATLLDTWQQWNIDLKAFSAAGVNLQSVKKMYIGVGDKDAPTPGGTGSLYIDDIRLYRARCVPSLGNPDADFSGNCVVDYPDLEIMANEWLGSGPDLQADLDDDSDVDLKDYAVLADSWLDEMSWP